MALCVGFNKINIHLAFENRFVSFADKKNINEVVF